MKKRHIYIIAICMIVATAFIAMGNKGSEKTIITSSGGVLSNKKIGWGIKRNDNHEQPDLGTKNLELINENGDIAIGNAEDKYVYLTFDNGYEAGYTAQILDTLKSNEVKATFFITGHYLNTQEELVKRMIDEGHIVGNHTVNHPSMPDLENEKLKEEISKLHTTVYEKYRL